MIRLAAINQIDSSDYTEPVVVKTQEEGKIKGLIILYMLYTK